LDTLCFATSATAAYRQLQAIRIKSIQIWGPMDSTLAPQPVVIIWTSASSTAPFGGPAKIISDTSMGSSECAYVSTSPPRGSFASQWFQNSSLASATVMEIGCPINSIIDVLFEGVLNTNGQATFVGTTIAGATVGVTYIRALDSQGSSNIVPQVVATI
jgi:uncharacterized protein YodC (DUF2158 family)